MRFEPTADQCSDCGAPLSPGALGGTCPRCLARSVLSDEETDLIETLPRRFGDFELLERIAQGGMGVVYRARQLSLRRIVAVKLLLAGEFATREFVQRFRREASSAAVLQHPNIVAIHDVGVHEGQHYFSMDHVEGRDLARVVATAPLPGPRAARYVRTIAEAIHFAHERGILHRDLKPSNVIIDDADQPRVTDFGLARRLDQSASLTVTGQILGSPGFMPPEQAGALGVAVGPASDVYSLGAILYHALTARPPFQGETLPQILQQAISCEPVPPRRLNPAVPVDLETICLKCLAKEPSRRYATARELADELGRFLAGHPIHARPIGRFERAWRWCRQHPAPAALTVALTVSMFAGLAGVIRELRRAERAERATGEQLGRAYLEQARANRLSGRSGQRFDSLEVIRKAVQLPTPPDRLELRNEAVAALALPDIRWDRQGALRPSYVAVDQALTRCAWFDANGVVHVCRVTDDRELFVLPAMGTNVVPSPAFSRSGELLAVPYGDGCIRIWNLETREVKTRLTGGRRDPVLKFGPRDERLAVTGQGNVVLLFDVSSGHLEREYALRYPPRRFDYSPDGRYLSILSPSANVELIDTASGRTRTLDHGADAYGFAWHASGERLAVSTVDQAIHLWDLPNLESRRIETDHQSTITELAFNPRGDLLVSGSWDGNTRLWDVATGRRLANVPRNFGRPRFSPDGRSLVGYSPGFRRLEFFAVEANPACRFLPGPSPVAGRILQAWSIDWSADEKVLCAATTDGVCLWDAVDGRMLGLLPHPGVYVGLFDPLRGGITACGGSRLQNWPMTRESPTNDWTVHPARTLADAEALKDLAMSSDGQTAAYVHSNWVTVWTNGVRAHHLPHQVPARLAVSPGGRQIGTVERWKPEIKMWDAATGRLQWRRSQEHLELSRVAFTADGRWLVSGSADEFTFWNAATGEPGVRFPRRDAGDLRGPMAFSQDGRLMALAVTRTLVQLRDPVTGENLAELDSSRPQMISALAFNPSGTQLAVLGETHSLQLWDLRSLRRELATLGLDWDPPSPSGATGQPPTPARLNIRTTPFVIRPRSPETPAHLLDLTKFYTGSLEQMWPDVPENTLADLPSGHQLLQGVEYDLRGVVALRSWRLPGLPGAVRDIPVGQRCSRLHFLHGAAFSVPEGTKVGTYVIHYADGAQAEVPLLAGYNTHNWWLRPGARPSRLNVAWSGTNPAAKRNGSGCHLFHLIWENPRPDEEILALDFISTVTECSPFLVAVTAN